MPYNRAATTMDMLGPINNLPEVPRMALEAGHDRRGRAADRLDRLSLPHGWDGSPGRSGARVCIRQRVGHQVRTGAAVARRGVDQQVLLHRVHRRLGLELGQAKPPPRRPRRLVLGRRAQRVGHTDHVAQAGFLIADLLRQAPVVQRAAVQEHGAGWRYGHQRDGGGDQDGAQGKPPPRADHPVAAVPDGRGPAAPQLAPRRPTRSIRTATDRTRDVPLGVGDRCRFWPVHEDVVPTDVEALRLGDLALGDEAKLGVGEGVEGQTTDPQQPGA
jgi:hypothetical protein